MFEWNPGETKWRGKTQNIWGSKLGTFCRYKILGAWIIAASNANPGGEYPKDCFFHLPLHGGWSF